MRDEDKGADEVEMVKLLCTDELFHLAYNYCAWLLCSKRRSGNSLELEYLVVSPLEALKQRTPGSPP